MSGTSFIFKCRNLIFPQVTIFGQFLDLNVQTNIRSFYFYPKVKYESLHRAFQFVVSSLACKYQLKYQCITNETSKVGNVEEGKCYRPIPLAG